MKYKELHKLIKKNGWIEIKGGKHRIYKKKGKRYPAPFHGSKDIGKGLLKKIIKEMDLK